MTDHERGPQVDDRALEPCPFCEGAMQVLHGMLRHVDQSSCLIGAYAWHEGRIEDWNRRPLSAVEARPTQEPVAWRWREALTFSGAEIGWRFAIHPSTPPADAQPLYAAPVELDGLKKELEGLLNAAKGYMLNAKIDLETGTKKATTICTLDGGLKMIDAALSKYREKNNGRS